jgi:glycosyl transferase family 25
MRVYVINLDRAPERMAHMRTQFERLKIPFTRIAAVDAKLLTDGEIDAFRRSVADAARPHSWHVSQIGIFLSHKKAWAQIASEDDRFAAVFEDDVHLSDRIASLLDSDVWIDRSMDIVRLETTQQSMKLARSPILQKDGMKLFRIESSAWGAAGYLISRDIAEWLDRSPSRIYEPVDWFLFHPKSALAPGLRVFQFDPAPCVQDQYHPDTRRRQNFAMETKTSTSFFETLSKSIRRRLSPLIRSAMNRRGVPFA